MWANFQPLIYIGVLLSAAVYFYLRERDQRAGFAKKSFFVTVGLYLFSFFFEGGGFLYSLLGVLTPDVAFMVAVILVLNRFAPRPKMLYFAIFAVFAGIKLFFINPSVEYLWNDQPTQEQVPVIEETTRAYPELDQNAEFLMDVKSHTNNAEIKKLVEKYDLKLTLAFPDIAHPEYTQLDDYYTVNVPDHQMKNLSKIQDALMATGEIDDIEPNEIVQATPVFPSKKPRDPNRRPKYRVNDPGVEKMWGFEAMKAADLFDWLAENEIKPKKKAKIAILDTGVESDHEDISDNYFSVGEKNDYDKLGHGTHCAGIAAAVSNNGKGIASFAPNGDFVEVTSIKVLSDNGYGTQKGVLDGILKAADTKVDVISMSLGGPSNQMRQRAYNQAFEYARKSGAVTVVAAGNSNADATKYCPANSEGVISVAAIDPDINRASFSNKVGSLKMGIAAPGVNIFSTFPNGEYKFLNGTSMATPYVSGLVGVMKSLNPDLDTEQVYEILNKTGVDTKDVENTGKLIQAAAAVKAAAE
ncbi:MAG: S8 family serine peptidase [Bacteroidota bacterium]